MATSGSNNQTKMSFYSEVWEDFPSGNGEDINLETQPTQHVTISTEDMFGPKNLGKEELEHLNYVGYDWHSPQALFHYTSDYIENKDEFNQVYHLNGKEILEEVRDTAESIDRLLNQSLTNLSNFKEKAEYKAVKTIKKYDDLDQAVSKMLAEDEEQRVVEDDTYQQVMDIKNDIRRCVIRHVDNLEYEHNLQIRGNMSNYEVNPSF